MAAGGFRTFVAGETLDEDKINDFLMQGVLVFADATARDAAITAPVHGQVAFRKDSDVLEFYDSNDWVPLGLPGIEVEYLIVAGGGGGGGGFSGGGGAGGYRCNVVGEASGGGLLAEPRTFLPTGTYPLVVGAGGAASTAANVNGGTGTNSRFGIFFSQGGGGGQGTGGSTNPGLLGGSGGGNSVGGSTQPDNNFFGQGFSGGPGNGIVNSATGKAGGGGGAGQLGQTSEGGNGVSSSITGTATARAGGGGGVVGTNFAAAPGGTGGGGTGAKRQNSAATSGTANTGSGGGGGDFDVAPTQAAGAGGSGVVVLRVDSNVPVSFSGGVTHTTQTVGTRTAYIVTAAGPTDTVTIG
jgi:hypothetical protein